MEIRYIYLAVFALFFLVIIVISRRFKNATLDKIPFLPGEETIFDDDKCKLRFKTGPELSWLPKAYVRVTNQRLIVAQKALGRNMYVIRFAISYTGIPVPEGVGGGSLKTGYISYKTLSQSMSIKYEDGKRIITIEPYGEKSMGVPSWLTIETEMIDRFIEVLHI